MKIISIMLGITLVLASFTSAKDLDLSGFDVSLLNQQPDPVAPGGVVELRFSVERVVGPDPIENVNFRLESAFPLTVVDGDTRTVNIIRPKAEGDAGIILYYKLKVSSDATEGNNEVTLHISQGSSSIALDPFLVRIQSSDPLLEIVKVQSTPDPVLPGKPFDVTISLKNNADSVLYNIRSTIEVQGSSFSPYQSSNEQLQKSIIPQAEKIVIFHLIADGDTKSTIHKIPMTLHYEDSTGKSTLRNRTIGIIVNEAPDYRLMLEESTVLSPSSSGKVVFSLANTGTADLKFATLSLQENSAYEIIGPKTVYIGNVEADDFETAEFTIYLNKKSANTVPLSLELSFKDNYNTMFTKQSTLPLTIYSKEQLKKYSLTQLPGKFSVLASGIMVVMMLLFMAFMSLDWWHNPMPRYKRILWLLMILTGIGAFLYYLLARKKREYHDS